ncbi:hypothetical protein ZWY2020_047933 [Hordeum vulgare]|nr:hypothetical protein ZWY2020_047933 [Hordeum vulgare]
MDRRRASDRSIVRAPSLSPITPQPCRYAIASQPCHCRNPAVEVLSCRSHNLTSKSPSEACGRAAPCHGKVHTHAKLGCPVLPINPVRGQATSSPQTSPSGNGEGEERMEVA